MLLRPGAITRAQIEDLLQMSILAGGNKDAPPSPGTKYRHYAPIAPVRLCHSLKEVRQGSDESFILSREPTGIGMYRPLNAKTLYSFLREADRIQAKEIWVLIDPITAVDEALMNRLRRATE